MFVLVTELKYKNEYLSNDLNLPLNILSTATRKQTLNNEHILILTKKKQAICNKLVVLREKQQKKKR